ncbi:hypothetical protein PR202_ga09204 [Eleusine coracana subsp. coracana]|uniref:Uncharacterized protein n=1 Tax=Eleusine coracana subsp. coracana TaxID=191504 RepID=A0AAV5C360_ELECO|nr:hypothetical protein PR202_ga09204 [Eleusine coracana subsp. coracana]
MTTIDDPEKISPSENDAAEEQQTKNILKRTSSFVQASVVAATGISTTAFSVGKDVKLHRHVLVAGGFFLVLAYFSALLLLYFKIFLSECRKLRPGHVRVLQVLCLTSGAALVATNSLLLLLLNKGNALLALNLIPVQVLVGMVAYRATPTEDSLRDEAFEAAVKSASKVALVASAAAFSLQTALVFGYLSNAKFQALAMGGRRLDISVSFLASALGMFLVVATCMPIGYRTDEERNRVLSIIRCLKDAVVAVLALTAVTLGQEFLGGNAALAFFPEIAVATMYYAVTLLSDEQGRQQIINPSVQKMEVLPIAVVATFGFGMLGAAYAALLGTPEYDVYTKALVFTLLAAVMSSLGRMAGPLCGAFRRDKDATAWVVFLGNILPVVEMLVAVPLAAKVVIDFLPVA